MRAYNSYLMTRLVRRLFFLGKVSPLLVVVCYTRKVVIKFTPLKIKVILRPLEDKNHTSMGGRSLFSTHNGHKCKWPLRGGRVDVC